LPSVLPVLERLVVDFKSFVNDLLFARKVLTDSSEL
jgi:hypothetical protein